MADIDLEYIYPAGVQTTSQQTQSHSPDDINTLLAIEKIYREDLEYLSSVSALDPTEAKASLKEQLAGLEWAIGHVQQLHGIVESAINKKKEELHG